MNSDFFIDFISYILYFINEVYKMKRNYPSIIITPEGEKWLDKGQMWMYKNNLGSLDDSIENGSLVDIMTTQGRYLGTGFLSKESHITVRILTKDQNEVIDKNSLKENSVCL